MKRVESLTKSSSLLTLIASLLKARHEVQRRRQCWRITCSLCFLKEKNATHKASIQSPLAHSLTSKMEQRFERTANQRVFSLSLIPRPAHFIYLLILKARVNKKNEVRNDTLLDSTRIRAQLARGFSPSSKKKSPFFFTSQESRMNRSLLLPSKLKSPFFD